MKSSDWSVRWAYFSRSNDMVLWETCQRSYCMECIVKNTNTVRTLFRFVFLPKKFVGKHIFLCFWWTKFYLAVGLACNHADNLACSLAGSCVLSATTTLHIFHLLKKCRMWCRGVNSVFWVSERFFNRDYTPENVNVLLRLRSVN